MNETIEIKALFKKGIDQFEKGDYFEAHEVWEDLWSDYYLPDRKFIQGLIQLAVSFVHLGNGNMIGARNLLRKCQNKFADFQGIQRGINIDTLKSRIETVEAVYQEIQNSSEFDWDLVPSLQG